MGPHVNLSFGIYVADHPEECKARYVPFGQKAPSSKIQKSSKRQISKKDTGGVLLLR